ncbi:MAG: diheme cytochrome C [Leptolyngbyaceae cyanobacterium RU_5_1]|nr:diheme cytochrome C [Leptolyngbyaceae cyanobacterium RU_5_1]
MSYPPKRHFRLHRYALKRAAGHSRPNRRRSVLVLLILLLLWSLCLGIGLAQATEPRQIDTLTQASPASKPVDTTAAIGTVDVVSERYQAGQTLYLENCATCHLGLPPAVMPSETWRQLLQDSQHYGAEIKPLDEFERQIAWQYLRQYSRPHMAGESIPYRVYQSRFFKSLHPRVKFAQRVNLNGCISCHPGADKYDFRSLSAEWQNAP